jgi:hypothetical protein
MELTDSNLGPDVDAIQMDYHKGSFIINYNDILYMYNLDKSTWTQKAISGKRKTNLTDYTQCLYKDTLYMIMGWDILEELPSSSIFKINLSNENYEAKEIPITNKDIAEWTLGYKCRDSFVYLFGGGSHMDGHFNSLSKLDLSQPELKFEILNTNMKVPTARQGHAMEVYNDKLYIFGGVDSNGER